MIERIERAMVLLAYFIEIDGDEHVPMFEKFEAELKELRQAENARARARRLLELHSIPGTLIATRVDTSSSKGVPPRIGKSAVSQSYLLTTPTAGQASRTRSA